MERDREVMVALTESVMENRLKRPSGGKITMTSYPACNKTSLSRKPCIPDTNLPWNAIGIPVMVARSESVVKNRVKAPWRITIMKSWLLSNYYKKNSKY